MKTTMLDSNFLAPYRAKGDPFESLLARSTYLGKYRREEDASWTDTIARVVLGSVALDPNVSEQEAHFLFDTFWTGKALPPGRGLWTGGVPNIPIDARYNCHYGTLRSYDDWCWLANMLMCGGGVGIGLQHINELPLIQSGNGRLFILCSKSHANCGEVMPDDPSQINGASIIVDDTREGWVEALRSTFHAAFNGHDLAVNVSPIRKRGMPIKTFGGVACGPGPLATLLRSVYGIIRGASSRHFLNSIDCLDITNHIGVCIKSGNVRRSALIVLGNAHDTAFREAKQDWQAVMSHRHSSNNSIAFETEEEIDAFDFAQLVEDNATYGEPGIVNLWKIRQTDPYAEGVNPCGEINLHDREACCLSEVYPALIGSSDYGAVKRVLQAITRYTLRQRLQPMSDARADAIRKKNMRIGVGLGGICDFSWSRGGLAMLRMEVQEAGRDYASELGVYPPIAYTTVKPSGTISLLNGSSPGIHAPFAPYYIRRTRIGKDEAMAQALLDAGVPNEKCVYDKTGQTLVFEFPMRARQGGISVQTETAQMQIERQVAVQESWADNAVSATISFADHEKADLAFHLRNNIKKLKSTSCLPKSHGYAQAPYTSISKEEYVSRYDVINHNHALTVGGELSDEGCEADGTCPIR